MKQDELGISAGFGPEYQKYFKQGYAAGQEKLRYQVFKDLFTWGVCGYKIGENGKITLLSVDKVFDILNKEDTDFNLQPLNQ